MQKSETAEIWIGKYRVIAELGRGGSSIVYLAEDPILEKLWAVKAIPKENGKRLEEALIMRNLDHHGLPRITGQMEDDTYYYLVMDYIEGKTLYEECRKNVPGKEKVVDWGIQICDILEYLHNRKPPIIYRDLKPGNLILTPDGSVKLVDFGIAREQSDEKMDSFGTRGFAAPEQYKGKASVQSDIYNLGACLRWFLKSQKVPELELVLRKCLRENPKQRFQSAAKVKRKLLKLQTKWEKSKKERKILMLLLMAVLLLGIGEIVREGITGFQNALFISLTGEKKMEIQSVSVNGQEAAYRCSEKGIHISFNCFETGENEVQIQVRDEDNKVYYITHNFDF